MTQLPPHIISNIARYAATVPDRQLDILALCSDAYLGAIPTLYHSPHLASSYDSFFLNTATNLPADFASLTPAQLVRSGHNKAAALRYVHHLHIDIPWFAQNKVYTAASREERVDIIRCEREEHDATEASKQLVAAFRSLEPIPIGNSIMPSLNSVQVGMRGGVRPALNDPSDYLPVREFFRALFRRTRPTVWCQNPARIAGIVSHIVGKSHAQRDIIPPEVHLHAYFSEVLEIRTGCTTFIYVHGAASASESDLAGLTRWLGESIRRSFSRPVMHEDPMPLRKTIVERTRIVISGLPVTGLTVPVAGSSTSAEPTGGGEGEAECGELRKMVERIRAAARGHHVGPQWYAPLQIEVRGPATTLPCPGCGVAP